MNRKRNIKRLVFASLVAAAYTGLTYLSGFFGLAYGSIQLRISEVLTVLPCFSPSSIVGLAVGCFLGNIASFNPIDMLFGTLATLISAVLTYIFRKIKFFGVPILSLLSPVIVNALVIGFELTFFFTGAEASFVFYALSVALGEAAVCLLLGIPFYILLDKHRSIFDMTDDI